MIVALAAIFFLELRSKASLADLRWMPRELVRFFDSHDFLNNVVAFGGLAATAHFAATGWNREAWPRVVRRTALMCALVVALECAQLLRPQRVCDWHDVVAGWLGLGLASLIWLRPNAGSDSHHGG